MIKTIHSKDKAVFAQIPLEVRIKLKKLIITIEDTDNTAVFWAAQCRVHPGLVSDFCQYMKNSMNVKGESFPFSYVIELKQ